MAYVSVRLFTGTVADIGGTAVQLGSALAGIHEVMVQSDPANVGKMAVGNVTAQYITLTPGQAISIPVNTVALVYVRMLTGTGVANWLATE
jgi:hypothetical protein